MGKRRSSLLVVSGREIDSECGHAWERRGSVGAAANGWHKNEASNEE